MRADQPEPAPDQAEHAHAGGHRRTSHHCQQQRAHNTGLTRPPGRCQRHRPLRARLRPPLPPGESPLLHPAQPFVLCSLCHLAILAHLKEDLQLATALEEVPTHVQMSLAVTACRVVGMNMTLVCSLNGWMLSLLRLLLHHARHFCAQPSHLFEWH